MPMAERARISACGEFGVVIGLQGRLSEAEGIAKADLPPEEAAANVAYLKRCWPGKENAHAAMRRTVKNTARPIDSPGGTALRSTTNSASG